MARLPDLVARGERSECSSVASILERKRQVRVSKETKGWSYAEHSLHCTTSLRPGDKVFVRFLMECYVSTEDEAESDDEECPPPKRRREEEETPSSSPDELGKILETNTVWWPATVDKYNGDKEGYETAGEWWSNIDKSNYSDEVRASFDKLIETHGELPVWKLSYEAQQGYDAVSIPCIFTEGRETRHLSPDFVCSAPFRREDEMNKDRSAPADEDEDEDVDEAVLTSRDIFGILAGSCDVETLSCSDPVVRKVTSVVRNVLRELVNKGKEGEAAITSSDVWASFEAGVAADDSPTEPDGCPTEPREGLQDQPFPRASSPRSDRKL